MPNINQQAGDLTKPSPASDKLKDNDSKPSKFKLGYDIIMLLAIVADLLLIGVDRLLLTGSMMSVGEWLGFADWLEAYRHSPQHMWHGLRHYVTVVSGFFTLYLVIELLVRWGLSVMQRQYYRWFFFPFVHWYEVLGCIPQLRALRLLRAVVIGRRLHVLGYQVLPKKWLQAGKFYYGLVLEELSDRVLLTATSNIRTQLTDSHVNDIQPNDTQPNNTQPNNARQSAIKHSIEQNREHIEAMILSLLRDELAPRLQQQLNPKHGDSPLAKQVGMAVGDAIANTPELHRLLKMIPIAGGMIESQLTHISQRIGHNLVNAASQRLLSDAALDALFVAIAQGIADIDIDNPKLEQIINNIIDESLTAFERQIKIQQWKHKAYFHL